MTAEVEQQLGAGHALMWAGDIDGARASLDAIIEAHGDPTAHFLRGVVNYMDDRLDDVCRDWEAAFQGFRERGALEQAARAAMCSMTGYLLRRVTAPSLKFWKPPRIPGAVRYESPRVR